MNELNEEQKEAIAEDASNVELDGEGTDEVNAPGLPPVLLSHHELGGIKVTTRGADGTVAVARLDIDEAALINSHLTALITMAFEAVYMQQAMLAREAQENAQNLYVPAPRR